MESRVACAVTSYNTIITECFLPDNCSVYTAELTAIYLALSHCHTGRLCRSEAVVLRNSCGNRYPARSRRPQYGHPWIPVDTRQAPVGPLAQPRNPAPVAGCATLAWHNRRNLTGEKKQKKTRGSRRVTRGSRRVTRGNRRVARRSRRVARRTRRIIRP